MSPARHRAPRRLQAPAGSGRRAAVLASSGMLLVVATSATAAAPAAPAAPPQVRAGVLSLSDAARTAMSVSPVVRVAADIEWETDTATLRAGTTPAT